MTREKEEGNEAGSQGSRNVELNIKVQGDHVSDSMEVFIHVGGVLTHLTQ